MLDLLRREFPDATDIQVVDISGGCGAMFEVHVRSRQFNGMNRVKQHMTVNNVRLDFICDHSIADRINRCLSLGSEE